MFKRKQVAPERRNGKALVREMGVFPFARIVKGDQVDVIYGEEAIAAEIMKHKVRPVFTPDLKKMAVPPPPSIAKAIASLGEQKQSQNQATKKPEDKVNITVVLDCYLMEGLSTYTTDCLLYGFAAVEGEGARKARVMTDSCFSVRPYQLIQRLMKFNVIDEQKHTSSTITNYDYTMPEVFLPSVITCVDLTQDEFLYVLGNVRRTLRYGKETSRQGFMRNHILGIAFSNVELFANLELSQAFYDAFASNAKFVETGELSLADFDRHAAAVLHTLTKTVHGRCQLVTKASYLDELKKREVEVPRSWSPTLDPILQEVQDLYQDEEKLAGFLHDLNTRSASFQV